MKKLSDPIVRELRLLLRRCRYRAGACRKVEDEIAASQWDDLVRTVGTTLELYQTERGI